MEKCVLLHRIYVMVIIQPGQVNMWFFRSEKKTNRLTLFLFYGEYFHERREIAEGKFLLNTFMVQI